MAVILAKFGQLLPVTPYLRCLSASAILSGRGGRRVENTMRALGLSEEEAEDLGQKGMETIYEASPETIKGHAQQLDRDVARYQRHLSYKTIERKYFREYEPREPNLLTWSMKEQMRYLHSTDPDRWTPEVLAKSFPSSPQGVKRLLRSRWVPENDAGVERHDSAVAARWKKHMKGQLGSYKLIEKSLLQSSKETAPVPIIGTEQVLDTLEHIKFDGEERIYKPKGVNSRTGCQLPPRKTSTSQKY